MPADSLSRLVNGRDREHAQRSRVEPERLILAPRTTAKRQICYDCRRPPSPEAYRTWWLAKHPLPKRFCRAGQWGSAWCKKQFKTTADHRQWHERTYVEQQLPDMKHLTECPFCAGRLIEIS